MPLVASGHKYASLNPRPKVPVTNRDLHSDRRGIAIDSVSDEIESHRGAFRNDNGHPQKEALIKKL